jgi:4-hydroxy-tetrahydrodipicolinate synthase
MTPPAFTPRVIPALVTPMTEGGKRVDLKRLATLANALVGHGGCDGVLVNGTTAESPTLSRDEKLAALQAVQTVVPAGTPVMACVGGNNTDTSVAEAEATVAETGVQALLLCCPYYNRPSQDGLKAHFSAIAEAVPDTPLVLYNIPARTGVEILPDTLAALHQTCPNIVGVKQSLGSMDTLSRILELLPPDQTPWRVWSGDDSLTLPMMALGAHGVISVSANLVGLDVRDLVAAMARGDLATARSIHLALGELHRELFCLPNPTMVKAFLAHLGWIEPHLRLPLVWPHQPEVFEKIHRLSSTVSMLRPPAASLA